MLLIVSYIAKMTATFQYPGSLGGHSNINTYRLNMYAFKNIGRVPWIWSTLYPGDCIFTPAGRYTQ